MSSRSKLVVWALAACATTALCAGVVAWRRSVERGWTNFLLGDPRVGARVFRQKGCAQCHSVNGSGGHGGPDLGFQDPPQSSPSEVVTAMWNHAPRMFERIRSQQMSYPSLDNQDTAHLFAYLYASRYEDEPGDASKGHRLFEQKACLDCHSVNGQGGKAGPDLSAIGVDTPIAWTQVMWNHAPAMESRMRQAGLPWPTFQGREMNDLLAYVRSVSGGPRNESGFLPADPDRGARLFESKSCSSCHSVAGEGTGLAPSLSRRSNVPRTIVQFAGEMWNHSPEMMRAMRSRGIARPTFEGREMADVIAYLYSLRYFDGGGSAATGRVIFAKRGCNDCHGAGADGTAQGPALRKSDRVYTATTLATALWQHGPDMYQRCQELGKPWPMLADNDVGDLIAFLNSAPVVQK